MWIEGFDYDNHLTGEIKKWLADDWQISQEEAAFMVERIEEYWRKNIIIEKEKLVALWKEFWLNYSKISKMWPSLERRLREKAKIIQTSKSNLYNLKLKTKKSFFDLTGKIEIWLAYDWHISQEDAAFMVEKIDKYWRKNIIIEKEKLVALWNAFWFKYKNISKMWPKLEHELRKRAEKSFFEENGDLFISQEKYKWLPWESHRVRELKIRTVKDVEKDFPDLPNNEKRKLFKTIMESRGIKKDCYSFVYYIAKELKKDLPILNRFISYNRKYNSKKNWYRWSMTQFLSKFEKTKSTNFKNFINELKNSQNWSIFLVSMNTSKKPYYEHTWFISIENWKIYFTHWETFKKSWAQWAKKTEIKQTWWYFDSSTIRKRYKAGYFNLKKIK